MNVLKYFWVDAVSIACFFINMMPSSILNWIVSYHQLFQNNPLFPIDPNVFGCTCFVQDVRPQVSKLDPKSLKCILVGYSRVQKGYRCYCLTLRRYFVSTNVAFFETIPFSLSSAVTSQGEEEDLLVYALALPTISSEPAHVPAQMKPPITQVYTRRQHPLVSSPPPVASTSDPILSDDLPIALRKGKRRCAHPISFICSYDHLSSHSYSFIVSLDSISLPNKVFEALTHVGWRSAMIEEMDALTDNGILDLLRLPVRKKVSGCRWVFTMKANPDGSIARLKARLVAKGYA